MDAVIARYIDILTRARLKNDNLMQQMNNNGFFPPALMAQQALDHNLTPEDLLARTITGFDIASKMIESLEEVVNPLPLASGTTAKRGWALVEKFNRSRNRSTGQVLESCARLILFQEDGHWVLTNLDDPSQVAAIQRHYPDLAPATTSPAATCARPIS